MDKNVKFMKEPECWVGPNSILAEPAPFRDVSDSHFDLLPAQIKQLEKLVEKKRGTDVMGLPPASTYVPKNAPQSFLEKQAKLGEVLDGNVRSIYNQPDKLKSAVEELWKLNNIQVYDLSNVEYDNTAAMKSLEEFNQRIEASKPTNQADCSPQAIQPEPSRPVFLSKKMKTESITAKKSVTKELLSFED